MSQGRSESELRKQRRERERWAGAGEQGSGHGSASSHSSHTEYSGMVHWPHGNWAGIEQTRLGHLLLGNAHTPAFQPDPISPSGGSQRGPQQTSPALPSNSAGDKTTTERGKIREAEGRGICDPGRPRGFGPHSCIAARGELGVLPANARPASRFPALHTQRAGREPAWLSGRLEAWEPSPSGPSWAGWPGIPPGPRL